MGLNVAVAASEAGRSFAVNVNGVDVGTVATPPRMPLRPSVRRTPSEPTVSAIRPVAGVVVVAALVQPRAVFAGCYVSDADGGSHGDPWSDGQTWPADVG